MDIFSKIEEVRRSYRFRTPSHNITNNKIKVLVRIQDYYNDNEENSDLACFAMEVLIIDLINKGITPQVGHILSVDGELISMAEELGPENEHLKHYKKTGEEQDYRIVEISYHFPDIIFYSVTNNPYNKK